ncbi:MAG: hypothetical protein ABIU54_06515 [Candidatus Eisenbacteria bacterium]
MGGTMTIRIGTPAWSTSEGGQRVTADVDGVPVWFESPDLPLVPSAESFASLFLVPAMARGATIFSQAPLDALWLENSRELMAIFHEWWHYPIFAPQAPADAARPASTLPESRARALFFSGGVDSFHGLLSCGEQVELLVFLQGFDIPIHDQPRADAALASLRAIASELGMRSGFVRTNLREHPLLQQAPWERTNGGALASVAHVLAGVAHELLIASSIATSTEEAWGSHWRTDKLFSSSRMELRQVGETHRRMHKIQALAHEPLARRHLRVCWANATATGNCSRCAKCTITRLVLAHAGVLDAFTVFDGSATLARDLDGIRSDKRFQTLDELSRSPRLEPHVRAATRALYKRSVRIHSLPVRVRRALIRKLLEWTRPIGR